MNSWVAESALRNDPAISFERKEPGQGNSRANNGNTVMSSTTHPVDEVGMLGTIPQVAADFKSGCRTLSIR
jgi:hypothetical protein